MEITKVDIVKDKYVVARLQGEIDLYNSVDIKQWFDDALQNPEYEGMTPVLDMTRVPFIDSSGIGTLISLDARMKKQKNARLILASLSEGVAKIFMMCRLDSFFVICGSVDNL